MQNVFQQEEIDQVSNVTDRLGKMKTESDPGRGKATQKHCPAAYSEWGCLTGIGSKIREVGKGNVDTSFREFCYKGQEKWYEIWRKM